MKKIRLYIMVFGLLIICTAFLACSHEEHNGEGSHGEHVDHDMAETASHDSVKPWNKYCPVVGEEVDPEVRTIMYNGKAYGFCCEGCDSKFEKEPAKYAKNLSVDGTKFIAEDEG